MSGNHAFESVIAPIATHGVGQNALALISAVRVLERLIPLGPVWGDLGSELTQSNDRLRLKLRTFSPCH